MDTQSVLYKEQNSLYRVVRMPPDGSCLFHAICHLIYGNSLFTNEIRGKIVNYVLANWHRFQISSHDFKGDNYTSPEHYQIDMLKPTTYGSACELIAASEVFHCIFRVHHNGVLLHSFGREGSATEYHLLFTGNLSSGHFDVLEATTPHITSKVLKRKLSSQPVESPHEAAKEENGGVKKKRTKRKGRFSNSPRLKQLRASAAKYAASHPEVHRAAVAKYTQSNPEVHRAAVAKYTQTNPEVNRAAVAKYTQENPEVNRAAVAKYTQENPEVHRAAVAKYTQENPEVH